MGSVTPLPYWQINVPPNLRTSKPPPFLENISPKDIGILSTPDEEYTPLTWPAVKDLILTNRIDRFQRLPSDLRRYLESNYQLKQKWGSVMAFVLSQRLSWAEEDLQPVPKEEESGSRWGGDGSHLKVLWNDWPYGLDERIVHLVVWTKFELKDDPATGDLTARARAEIDDYVNYTFASKLGRENVIWFKNWKSLKSIHAVEHFHVMMCDPDPRFVEEITNGDVPLSRMI